MHPLHVDMTAHMITEERLRHAAAARRVRALGPSRRPLRMRLGARLVRMGHRLEGRRPAFPQHATPC